jgi:hypothetical protein
MAAPSPSDYGTAAAAAYKLSNGTFTVPPGWTLIEKSSSNQRLEGSDAVYFRGTVRDAIAACEGRRADDNETIQ